MLLNVVDSVTFPLPHTNEAAKIARKKAFALQLRFGYPFIFFTITLDDGSSYIVSIYIGLRFNLNENIEDFTAKDFQQRASLRHEFRIKYPGFGALWYKAVMNAIWKHIIGWDWEKKQATEEPGIYGIPEAASQSTEEQKRKRLHGHCLAWIKGAQKLLELLQSSNMDDVLNAQQKIVEIFD